MDPLAQQGISPLIPTEHADDRSVSDPPLQSGHGHGHNPLSSMSSQVETGILDVNGY